MLVRAMGRISRMQAKMCAHFQLWVCEWNRIKSVSERAKVSPECIAADGLMDGIK